MLERHNSNMRPGHTFGSDNALEDALGLLGLIAIEGGKIGSAVVTVAPVPVASVTVIPSPGSVYVGQSIAFAAQQFLED